MSKVKKRSSKKMKGYSTLTIKSKLAVGEEKPKTKRYHYREIDTSTLQQFSLKRLQKRRNEHVERAKVAYKEALKRQREVKKLEKLRGMYEERARKATDPEKKTELEGVVEAYNKDIARLRDEIKDLLTKRNIAAYNFLGIGREIKERISPAIGRT